MTARNTRTAEITSRLALLVSLCAAGFSLWQALISKDRAKAQFAVERAYVLNVKFNGYGSAPIAPGLTANFWFNNFGKTPGILKIPPNAMCRYSVDGFHALVFKTQNSSLTDSSGLLPEGYVIPVDKPFGPFPATLDATKEQIAHADTGVGKIYCEAIIGYTDVRDNLHETGVCFSYDFSVKDFYLCAEKGANYHT
jgi:hypothetical protein